MCGGRGSVTADLLLFPGAPLVNPLIDALLGPQARTGDREGAAIVADAFRRASRRGMHTAIRSVSLARPDLTPVLDTICTPTLLTTGAHDPMWTTGNARAAASRLTHGALVIIPGAGHIGPLLQAPPTSPDWSPASGATQPPNWPTTGAARHHQQQPAIDHQNRPAGCGTGRGQAATQNVRSPLR